MAYVLCTVCQALNRPRRKSCFQCGERIALQRDPERDWFLSVNDEVRRHPRIEVPLTGLLLGPGGQVTEPVAIQDIGMGGVRFRTNLWHGRGSKVRLRVECPAGAFEMQGHVLRTNRMIDGVTAFSCAVQLEAAGAEFYRFVEQMLAALPAAA